MLTPAEFLLRYCVIIGIIFCVVGLAVCFMAKKITMIWRKQDTFDKADKLYQAILFVGVGLCLVGMICIALPIDTTFYKG